MRWTRGPLLSTPLTMGVMRPLGVATATETSTLLNWRMTPSRHELLTVGTFLDATAMALMRKSLTESLYLPSEERVQGLAQLQKLGDGQGGGDVEVGVLGHGLLEAVGDGLAHAADRDILEQSTGAAARGTSARGGLLDVVLGDLAARARRP